MAKSTEPRPVLRALHMSDVHIDLDYAEGSLANCNKYLCCRSVSGYPTKKGDIAAGEWGSPEFDCDIPVKTFQSMLDHVIAENLPDMVFWTGDNSPHNIWDNAMDESVVYTAAVSTLIKNAFEGKNVTIMPIQGNHDTWPEEI